MRVLFDSKVLSVVEAVDAFAWISAILVALFLVIASSLVVLEASSTSLFSLTISLHCPLSETALAATDVASRRETTRDWKCMMKAIQP